jgi:hypothetical protein
MLIAGEWQVGVDGVSRPVVRAMVRGMDGKPHLESFLVDPGADRTVFRATLWRSLGLQGKSVSERNILQGIGGSSRFVEVTTLIELPRMDGQPVQLEAPFAASTDPQALDYSLLGRDVLDHFDLILSKRRSEVLMLAGIHQYAVAEA